ncbi:MAG: AAA family ATPase [bacterium]
MRLSAETRASILELTARFRSSAALPGPAVELAERMARTHAKKGELAEGDDRPMLLPQHALDAYASMTGLPRDLLDPSAPFDIEDVRKHFQTQVFDQPEGVEAIVRLVTTLRAGLNSPARPLGSFLFLGPTGVGKTQTALSLAEWLFGAKDRLTRFDMSEYQDPWSAGRLVGRYQGEQGELVRRVREQPFQVILLDEIEKAHSNVFDFLLQVLGEGRLTDALGQTVSLTSCVVIMTSNLGAGGPSSLGFSARSDEAIRKAEVLHYMGAVEKFFRPEFVGRIDEIIPFRSLGERTARRLTERALEQAFSREGLVRRRIRVRATEAVIQYLIRVGFDARYGARPLRQTIEQHVTAPLAKFLSEERGLEDLDLVFGLENGLPAIELDA